MEKIESFVDKAYQNANGKNKKILESKLEMKNHLLESYFELKSERKSEQEATKIAIKRFGGEKEIELVYPELFRVQKVFCKRLLNIALVFLVFSVIMLGIRIVSNLNDVESTEDIVENLYNQLGTENVVTDEVKQYIESIVNNRMYIHEIRLIYSGNKSEQEFYEEPLSSPSYQYKDTVKFPDDWQNLILRGGHSFYLDSWYVKITNLNFDGITSVLLVLLFLAYWVLFFIWSIVNAYHHKKLNFYWIFAFFTLNVVGYLIFRVMDNSEKHRVSHI